MKKRCKTDKCTTIPGATSSYQKKLSCMLLWSAIFLPLRWAILTVPQDTNDQEILWVDPSTGERFLVDARTGNSIHHPTNHFTKRGHSQDEITDTRCEARRRTLGQFKPNSLAPGSTDTPSSTVPVWLEKALEV